MAGPKLTIPFGIIGLPTGAKTPIADFEPPEFVRLIETKGMRFAWTRAAVCPCGSVNDQTHQPDPRCTSCDGTSWFYFGPKDYAPSQAAGELDDVHKAILAQDGAAVIRGIMTGVDVNQDAYDRLGNWLWGSALVTVRPENKLGHYDRLVHLDSEVAYSEVVETGEETEPLKTRYLATQINLITTEAQRFEHDTDFTLENGSVVWRTGRAPEPETRVAVHYLCHPQWIVIEHPKILRETTIHGKSAPITTPVGSPEALPIQALVRLEFLV